MPNFHKISAHRSACLALYKALLKHTKHLPFSKAIKNHAHIAITKGFRKGRTIQGLTNIRAALKSTYETETLFRHAATGHPTHTGELLQQLHSHRALKRTQKALSTAPSRPPPTFPPPTPPTTRLKRLKRLAAQTDPVARERWQHHAAIHRRGIPNLGSSSAFPVFRRPGRGQSAAMDMTIKRKIIKRQQRMDLAEVLEEHVVVGREEDAFDRLLRAEVGFEEGDDGGAMFGREADAAWKEVKARMWTAEERAVALTRRFEEIIEREKRRKEEAVREYKRAKRQRLRREKRESEAKEGGKVKE
ncbi:uncharacterized protein LAJ45_07372 [Morchella importuna]|uniref:uncharacterized protein n=1 Tax=Morchella importuna TaxID=1174673 RepID=UPI001E8CB61F|nr:uncharacterized protein LAJ45_07372 [Morchella importuna]KAH8148661.1 hypothetical protein LAJ45_07372 [Morchella importuna]